MKKIASVFLMVFFLAAGASLADEQKAEKSGGIMEWLKSLQRKIENLAPKKTMSMSTGVAGTRGAKDDEKAKLYWKGKKGDEPVTDEELIAFKEAVDLAASGETDAAARKLDEFISRFPASPLAADAKKTLEMVKNEKSAAAAEAKPAQDPKPAGGPAAK